MTRPIGSEIPLPTTSDGLEIGKIDKTIHDIEDEYIPQIKLYKSQIPMSVKQSFTLDEIIQWVEDAIAQYNKVKGIIDFFVKLFGKKKTIEDMNTHEIKTIILNEALKRASQK